MEICKLTKKETIILSSLEIEEICGHTIDHSFLQYKKEL